MNRREALRRTAAITGMAVSSTISARLLEGCHPSGKPGWPPIFLKKQEIDLISSIANLIIPSTDTVGALDVHVPEFIDLMLKDGLGEEEKPSFRQALIAFQADVEQEYGNIFEDCSLELQGRIMLALDNREDHHFSLNIKNDFYQIVKKLTVLGFFTSEQVMKNMLDYHPVPGRFEGCIPFGPDGKIFTTNQS